MSEAGGALDRKRSPPAAEDDSDCVVADTFDVGGGASESRFSEARGKKAKADEDAPTSLFALSAEQRRVEELIMSGKNVFFTGSAGAGSTRARPLTSPGATCFTPPCTLPPLRAGVGKSFLLNHIIGLLKNRYGDVRRPARALICVHASA
jgi:hypothetical protein